MKKLLRRTVLGLPLWSALLILTAVVALAWLLAYVSQFDIQGTSGTDMPVFHWEAPTCTVEIPPGVIDQCDVDATDGLIVQMSQIEDETRVRVSASFFNDDSVNLCVSWVDETPIYVDPTDMGPLPVTVVPTNSTAADFRLQFNSNLTPDQAISIPLNISIDEGSCP